MLCAVFVSIRVCYVQCHLSVIIWKNLLLKEQQWGAESVYSITPNHCTWSFYECNIASPVIGDSNVNLGHWWESKDLWSPMMARGTKALSQRRAMVSSPLPKEWFMGYTLWPMSLLGAVCQPGICPHPLPGSWNSCQPLHCTRGKWGVSY